MMIVRALEAGAELWLGPVTSHPLRGWQGIGKKMFGSDGTYAVGRNIEKSARTQGTG